MTMKLKSGIFLCGECTCHKEAEGGECECEQKKRKGPTYKIPTTTTTAGKPTDPPTHPPLRPRARRHEAEGEERVDEALHPEQEQRGREALAC